MKSPSDPNIPWYLQWLSSKHTTAMVLTTLGLLLVVFQINTILSSSFRVEIFGVEILEVQHLDEGATAAAEPAEERIIIRERRPAIPQRQPPSVRRPQPVPANPTLSVEDARVFVVVEEMPMLIGGLQRIQRAIRYPEIAQKAGIQGRVIVQFIVDEEGRVQDPTVVRGIGSGCDEEAVRVVSEARFRPGKQNGELVMVKMSLPVTFR